MTTTEQLSEVAVETDKVFAALGDCRDQPGVGQFSYIENKRLAGANLLAVVVSGGP